MTSVLEIIPAYERILKRRGLPRSNSQRPTRCRPGDPQTIQLLVERFHGVVFGLCLRMINHRQDAEDATQETFLRALRAIFGFDPARPIRPWLLEIAANRRRTAVAGRIRRQRLLPVSAAIDHPDPRAGPSDHGDLAREFERAVHQLRSQYRLVFQLYHEQSLSCEEIARSIDRPVGTVKTRLFRARAELAECLSRRGLE